LRHYFPDGKQNTLEYAYNLSGQIIKISDSKGVTNYEYDEKNRLNAIKRNGNDLVVYKYEDSFFGKYSKKLINNGVELSYLYAKENKSDWIEEINVKKDGDQLFNYRIAEYDAIGKRKKLVFSEDGYVYNIYYEYDGDNQLKKVIYPNNKIFSYDYRWSSQNRDRYESPLRTVEYDYHQKRVIGEDSYSGRLNSYKTGDIDVFVGYDCQGNINQKKCLRNGNEYMEYTYKFDNSNNMIEARIKSQTEAEIVYEYVYDHIGNRIETKKNGVTQKYYVWGQGLNPIMEKDEHGNVEKVNIYSPTGEKIAEEVYNGNMKNLYFYINDPLGTPLKVLNENNEVVYEDMLGPYGDVVIEDSKLEEMKMRASFKYSHIAIGEGELTGVNSYESRQDIGAKAKINDGARVNIKADGVVHLKEGFHAKIGSEVMMAGARKSTTTMPDRAFKRRFTGKEYEDDLNLYYFNARWYDPQLGRFLSEDPAGIVPGDFFSSNEYIYCRNNPVGFVDPDGRLSVYVHGTFSSANAWKNNRMDFINSMNTIAGDSNFHVFSWSGRNTDIARKIAGSDLASFINGYKFAESEKLNIFSHSHGGNVAILASQFDLQKPIDNLVLFGTPIRSEYHPRMSNINNLLNIQNIPDPIQGPGGFDSVFGVVPDLSGNLSFGGNYLESAHNIFYGNGGHGDYFNNFQWTNYLNN
jgi:RHS repeat-associated protein